MRRLAGVPRPGGSRTGDGAFERAHDRAWRAVQQGPKDDPALLFLLARAQALSGRPEDVADHGLAFADHRRRRD
ncbi:MAG: hypothetical protein R2712_27985 [Vicinamibacterales bacterium]